ncbi:hypothetical protein DAI22_01g266000 [Oryza sativa Japonica Group]|nr:hypothetical protein DAI22_01g266000 [Oryza sativa Japonica Group]
MAADELQLRSSASVSRPLHVRCSGKPATNHPGQIQSQTKVGSPRRAPHHQTLENQEPVKQKRKKTQGRERKPFHPRTPFPFLHPTNPVVSNPSPPPPPPPPTSPLPPTKTLAAPRRTGPGPPLPSPAATAA